MHRNNRRTIEDGFTQAELLVVIAILSLLLALLLPAMQRVRESGRRLHCENNLKQIALGLLNYHDSFHEFPSGGWGHAWVGVPERGTGLQQPGGWIYSLLPYIEYSAVHDLGTGETGPVATELYSRRLLTPLPLFVCPTRRPVSVWPVESMFSWVLRPRPYGEVQFVARADYAINAGSSHVYGFRGPLDLVQGDDTKFWKSAPSSSGFVGISHLRGITSAKSITDGTSKTYLVGEKYLDARHYGTGMSLGDNESLYAGFCSDLHRFAGAIENLTVDRSPFIPPRSDFDPHEDEILSSIPFGSAHPTCFNMAFCDGSVHAVSFDVDPEANFRAGHRRDDGSSIESLR